MNRIEKIGLLWIIVTVFWMVAPTGAYLEAGADSAALAAGDPLTVTGQTDREGGVWIWAVTGRTITCDHLETDEKGQFSWTIESARDAEGSYTLFVQDAGDDGQPSVTFRKKEGERGEVVAPEDTGFPVRAVPGLAGRLAETFEKGKGNDDVVKITVPVYPPWTDVDAPSVWEHGETITVSGTTNLAPGTVLGYELTEGGLEAGTDPARLVAEGETTVETGYGGRTWSFVLDTGRLNPGDHLLTLIDTERNRILATVERTVQGQEYNPAYLAFAGDRLVWTNPATDPDHLYLVAVEDGSTTQVDAGTVLDPHSPPALSAEHLVWVGKAENYTSTGHKKLFAYTIATGETTDLTEWKWGPIWPAVDGDLVVWKERDDQALTYSLRIAGYDLGTGTAEAYPTEEGWTPYNPRTSGGLVAWEEQDGNGNGRVVAYDTWTGTREHLSAETGWHGWPAVSEGSVVWAEMAGDEYAVMMQVSRNDRPREVAQTPDLLGFQTDGGRFIWQEKEDGKMYRLRMLDAEDGEVVTLISKEGSFVSLTVSGDRVAWIERGEERNEIRMYDIVTREETTLPAPAFLNLSTTVEEETGDPQTPGFGTAVALVALLPMAWMVRR